MRGVQDAGILEARAGKVRLLPRERLAEDWDPATDSRLTDWEIVQHLIRALETEGETALRACSLGSGSAGEGARDLAYRLYGICDRKKWAEEALAYNGLVTSWPEITRLAAENPSGTEAQTTWNLGGFGPMALSNRDRVQRGLDLFGRVSPRSSNGS